MRIKIHSVEVLHTTKGEPIRKYFLNEIPPIIPNIGDFFSYYNAIYYINNAIGDGVVQRTTNISLIKITGRHISKTWNNTYSIQLYAEES